MTCNKLGVQPMKPGQILTIKVPVYPATDEARELAGNGLRLWRGVCTKASAALAAVELATGVLEVDIKRFLMGGRHVNNETSFRMLDAVDWKPVDAPASETEARP